MPASDIHFESHVLYLTILTMMGFACAEVCNTESNSIISRDRGKTSTIMLIICKCFQATIFHMFYPISLHSYLI